MSEVVTTDEEAQIIVTLFGQPLTLVLPVKWSFKEGLIVKGAYDLIPTQVEAGIFSGDPVAYMAVLQISYMRAGQEFPEQEIEELHIFELVDAIQEKVEELGVKLRSKLPPTPPSGTESSLPEETSESEPEEAPVSV